MKKFMLIPALLAAMAVAGCDASGTNPGPGPSGNSWSAEIKEEMEYYLGETIPFVQLESATMYHEWDNEYNGYFVGDESYTDLVNGYSSKLTGWTQTLDSEGDVCYTKENSYGETLMLYYDWYEATDEYPQGNEIAIYVMGGSAVISGNTIDFAELGLTSETQYDVFSADDYDIEFGANGGSTGQFVTNANGDSIRVYKDGTITFVSDEPMVSIEFEWITPASKSKTPSSSTFEVDVGSYNYSTHVWTGSSTEVVFTCKLSTGHFALASVTVSF